MRFSLKNLIAAVTLICLILGIEEYRLSKTKIELEKELQLKQMWRCSSEYWQKNYYDYYLFYSAIRPKQEFVIND